MEKEDREQLGKEEATAQDVPLNEAVSMEELTSRLEEAEREREQFKRLLQRVQADFSNFRKRAEEEREESQQQANARLFLKLLPVLDEFELAIDQATRSSADPAWLEGVKLIHRKVSLILESEGVVRIEALGKQFDPFEHEAMVYQETGEQPEGNVMAVLRGGYKLHGKVLRPAQVVVAKAVPSQETENDSETEEEN